MSYFYGQIFSGMRIMWQKMNLILLLLVMNVLLKCQIKLLKPYIFVNFAIDISSW